MTEEKKEEIKKIPEVLCCGLDLGTGNLVSTRSDTNESKMLRNAYLKIDKDNIELSNISNINCVTDEEGNAVIIGNDAFSFANVFGAELQRPMSKGMISSENIDSLEIETLMIKNLIGDVSQYKKLHVVYSVPANPIDSKSNILYHKRVFDRIFKSLGFECSSENEGMAIIFSETAKENFNGISISFGSGMTNIAISIKGTCAGKFSTSRGGDWIDAQTSTAINVLQSRVTNIKEKYFDLEDGYLTEKDKKRRRVLEALNYNYEALIEYTVKKIIKEFSDIDLDLEEKIPIVIAGGTSLPKGFIEKFKEIISNYDLPFEISDIRHANHPLTSVSSGLLIKCLSDIS
jgi:hypothetical protein